MHCPSPKTHYFFGSHLEFSGDTPIDLNRERLQAPWETLAFREKALDSTPSACIVEHSSASYKFRSLKHFLSRGDFKPSNERVKTDKRQISKWAVNSDLPDNMRMIQ